jgi:hypothetical protein
MSDSVLDYMKAASGPSSAIAAVADLGSTALKIASPFIAELVQTSQQKMTANLQKQYEIFSLPDSDARAQRIADYIAELQLGLGAPTVPGLPGEPEILFPVSVVFGILTELNHYKLLLDSVNGVDAEVKKNGPATPAVPA